MNDLKDMGAVTVTMDTTRTEDVNSVVEMVKGEHGGADVLITNVGFGTVSSEYVTDRLAVIKRSLHRGLAEEKTRCRRELNQTREGLDRENLGANEGEASEEENSESDTLQNSG